MSGIFVSRAPAGLPRCKRCGRPFKPRKEGQEYGPRCVLKLAGQVELDNQALVSGKVLRRKTSPDGVIECRDEKDEVTAVIV